MPVKAIRQARGRGRDMTRQHIGQARQGKARQGKAVAAVTRQSRKEGSASGWAHLKDWHASNDTVGIIHSS